VTISAHNILIEIFAAGGYPILVTYVGIMSMGLLSAIRIIKNMKQFDPLATALIVGFLGYQAQSIISINQIGLAICGWAFTGALIGYSKHQSQSKENMDLVKVNQIFNRGNTVTPIIIGSVVGLVLALPPFIADAGWRAALNRGDAAAIIQVANQWPKDTYRMTNITFALEKSNLSDEAVKVARENVRFNPRSYDAWKLLVQISKSTEKEKYRGVEMMRKLDPLNIELK